MVYKAIFIYFLVGFISMPCIASNCFCKIKKKQGSLDNSMYQATVFSDTFKQEYLFEVIRESDDKRITIRNNEQVFILDLTENKIYTEHTHQWSKGQASTTIEAIELIITEYLLPNVCSRLSKFEQGIYPDEVPLLPGDFF